jgi:hypothetical protein
MTPDIGAQRRVVRGIEIEVGIGAEIATRSGDLGRTGSRTSMFVLQMA